MVDRNLIRQYQIDDADLDAALGGVLAELEGDDYDTGAKPTCAWDDLDARNELVTRLVNDALTVLAAVDGVDLTGLQSRCTGRGGVQNDHFNRIIVGNLCLISPPIVGVTFCGGAHAFAAWLRT